MCSATVVLRREGGEMDALTCSQLAARTGQRVGDRVFQYVDILTSVLPACSHHWAISMHISGDHELGEIHL